MAGQARFNVLILQVCGRQNCFKLQNFHTKERFMLRTQLDERKTELIKPGTPN